MTTDVLGRSGCGRPLCNLHVCHHSPENGFGRWARDFCQGDPFADNFVLESVGGVDLPVVEYRLFEGRSGRLIDSRFPRAASGETEVSPSGYRGLLEALCRSHRIAHIYVSSMVGHSPELLDFGIPLTIVHHDPSTSRELGDRYLRATADGQVTHVAPSHGLVHAIRESDRRFQKVSFLVIENGIDAAPDCFGGATADRRLRVAVLGGLGPNQGAGLLSQSFEALRLFADLYLIGSGSFGRYFESRWGVTVLGSHCREEELSGILRDISPDVGLLLSAYPQSEGYSLAELRARGIPPVAMRVGSYPEPILQGENGFLFSSDASSLVSLLARLDAQREELRTVAGRLRQQLPPTVRQMICRYYSLRQNLSRELESSLEGYRHEELHP